MKALVIGLGSMGRRRIRLLSATDPSIEIIGVDKLPERRKLTEDELNIHTIDSISKADCAESDIAFISTSPLSHAMIIQECLEKGLHVFTEINLVDNLYNENIELAKKKNKVLFLSSTFLYRNEIEYIKNEVLNEKGALTYMYHTGQYLPDWHPWEIYKKFFVGAKETNGCREIMAIEFPWIIETFGEIGSYHVMKGRQTTLEIDFPDNYQIFFEHKTGHKGMVCVDIVSRKAVRNFELFGENLYITWDGTPDGLLKFDIQNKSTERISLYDNVEKRDDYSSSIIENAYKSEIVDFLSVVLKGTKPKYSFEKDKNILSLINSIEI